MSRKTQFNHYILNTQSVKDIRSAGQGEEPRIVRGAIIVAAQQSHAPALTALLPLITVKQEFMEEVLDIIFSSKNSQVALLEAIPSNTTPMFEKPFKRFVNKKHDDIASQLVRIFQCTTENLRYVIPMFLAHNCYKTVEQALLKKNTGTLSIELINHHWPQCSDEMIDLLIEKTKRVNLLAQQIVNFSRYTQPNLQRQKIVEKIEHEVGLRQKAVLEKSLNISNVRSSKRKM